MKVKSRTFLENYNNIDKKIRVFLDGEEVEKVVALDFDEKTGYGSVFIFERIGIFDNGLIRKPLHCYIEKFGKIRIEDA